MRRRAGHRSLGSAFELIRHAGQRVREGLATCTGAESQSTVLSGPAIIGNKLLVLARERSTCGLDISEARTGMMIVTTDSRELELFTSLIDTSSEADAGVTAVIGPAGCGMLVGISAHTLVSRDPPDSVGRSSTRDV